MKTMFMLGAMTFFAAAASAGTAPTPPAVKIGATQKGPTLTDARGMTLYTFDKDATDKSTCVAVCAVNWPPLIADTATYTYNGWSRVRRDDGTSQWAYLGKPLYRWKNDVKPGDITGDGLLNNSWHVAQP